MKPENCVDTFLTLSEWTKNSIKAEDNNYLKVAEIAGLSVAILLSVPLTFLAATIESIAFIPINIVSAFLQNSEKAGDKKMWDALLSLSGVVVYAVGLALSPILAVAFAIIQGLESCNINI